MGDTVARANREAQSQPRGRYPFFTTCALLLRRLLKRWSMTQEQADQLAKIKFPCC